MFFSFRFQIHNICSHKHGCWVLTCHRSFTSSSYHPGLLKFRCPLFNKTWLSVGSWCPDTDTACCQKASGRSRPSQNALTLLFLRSQQKASGKVLLDLVCSHMNLVEGDYFGLEFQNHQKMMVRYWKRKITSESDRKNKKPLLCASFPQVWLDHIKPIIKQLRRKCSSTSTSAYAIMPINIPSLCMHFSCSF